MSLSLVLAVLVLTDVGPPPPDCVKDEQCVLSTFGGCGQCCPVVFAVLKGKDARAPWDAMRCGSKDCSDVTCSSPAPNVEDYRAACVRRRCTAVLKNPPPAPDAGTWKPHGHKR